MRHLELAVRLTILRGALKCRKHRTGRFNRISHNQSVRDCLELLKLEEMLPKLEGPWEAGYTDIRHDYKARFVLKSTI